MKLRSARKQAKHGARDPQRVSNRLSGKERVRFGFIEYVRLMNRKAIDRFLDTACIMQWREMRP